MKSALFAVCLIVTSSVCFGTEKPTGLTTSPTERQDANTVSDVVPVPQGVPATDGAAQLTLEGLQTARKKINESKELSDDIKAKVGELYDKAIAQLTSATEFESKKQQYGQTRTDVPNTLVKTKDLLAQQATVALPEAGPEITLAQAEQALAAARLALEEVKKNAANWENEPKRRAERRTKIPEESNSAKQKLDEIDTQLAIPAPEGQATELTQANRTLLLAQKRAVESQIASNTEELLFYDTATNLLAARRDLATQQQATAEKVVEF